ncbi:suppressor of fused domain protein [Paenibacillus sp. 19GGS1-52]|uniref:suppressor of fused domain protein n=1 Tax=Paenibacillus sp. 19GGS1-52 TaxID=2758563 RepID=UPI001EFA628A|nr:suppressor of fused domain protein [Paenibacillus sp. 19GGS1-52]ULO09532.1 suppressor of fused domain protein [Paenibacillus sp. 19GGS1-52]
MDFNINNKIIQDHYLKIWGNSCSSHELLKGPIHELPPGFKVLKFPPTSSRNMWAYATSSLSQSQEDNPIEIHVFAPQEQDSLIELLTVIAHYHNTGAKLKLGDTVNFGVPWLPQSKCEYGIISLPYLDGPSLEWLQNDTFQTRFLWLIPITRQEVDYKKKFGLDSLEEKFDDLSFNYLDPYRDSVV